MKRRRSTLADAYDPGRAMAWRVTAIVFIGAGAVLLGVALGLVWAEYLNREVFAVPGWGAVAAFAAAIAAIFGVLSAAFCIAAIEGPPDDVQYPASAPTVGGIPTVYAPTCRGGCGYSPSLCDCPEPPS